MDASLSSLLAVSLIVLALGLVLVEFVSAQLRRSAVSLGDAARRAASGARAGVAVSGVFEALAGVSRAIREALDAFTNATKGLGAGIGELDAARQSVVSLTDAQVADVEELRSPTR